MKVLLRRPLLWALIFAGLLATPSIFLSPSNDDFIHRTVIEEWRGLEGERPRSLARYVDHFGFVNPYHFFRGNPAEAERDLATGEAPTWWLWPQIRISFWRPLSSLTLLIDHVLFERFFPPAHVHSIVWYFALIGVIWLLFRRTLPFATAAVAILLYAIDDVHFLPVAWVANRNALVAAVPALAGLAAHVAWRESGWRPGRALSVLGLAIGLLGGEASLGVFAYLGAYELFGTTDHARQRTSSEVGPKRTDPSEVPACRSEAGTRRCSRIAALAPAGVLAVAWAIQYKLLGYGAYGSGLYIDPTRETGAYLKAALQRIPTLLGSALGGFPGDLWLVLPVVRPFQVAYGVLVTGISAWALRTMWAELDPREQRTLRWLVPGALGALVPVVATFPLDRLLILPSVGSSVVVAVVLRAAWRRWKDRLQTHGRDRALGLLAIPVIAVHCVVAPLGWFSSTGVVAYSLYAQDDAADRAELDPATISQQRLVVVVASDPIIGIYLPMVFQDRGPPLPRSWVTLSMAPHPHRLYRTGPRRLELEPVGGRMLETAFEELCRARRFPLHVGERITLPAMTAEVVSMQDGLPTRVAFDLEKEADDPSWVFVTWQDGTVKRVAMPAVGESVDLPWSPGPLGL